MANEEGACRARLCGIGSSLAVVVAGAAVCGCLPWAALLPGASGSIGTASNGLLAAPDHLPAVGETFRYYRAGDRRYGTPELVGLVRRAADRVAAQHPGSVLLVGDLSGPHGGVISEHGSHRSGRDVDLAFFLTDPAGRPVRGTPLPRLDRFGVGLRGRSSLRFDTARNWSLVEALLADPQAAVQWIFVSRGLKALLLDFALDRGGDLETARRAAEVLHQPGDSPPHDDHFHVRIYCPAGQGSGPCRDLGPVWPWIEPPARAKATGGYSDEELVDLALDGLFG
jgi:penicillin-insensitive murein endopeptidase